MGMELGMEINKSKLKRLYDETIIKNISTPASPTVIVYCHSVWSFWY